MGQGRDHVGVLLRIRLALHATADESKGVIGLREVIVSGSSLPMPIDSSSSSMDLACVVPASAVAPSASASSSSCPLASCLAGAVHARRTVTSMHALNAHNSCLNTGRVTGSHGHKEGQRWGFRSGRRFASCLRGGGRGKFSAGRRCTEAGCRFHSPGGNQAQVPGVSGKVRSHLPSTRRFLVSNSCHLDTDWTSGNRWAGRRCVEPHGRGFGC